MFKYSSNSPLLLFNDLHWHHKRYQINTTKDITCGQEPGAISNNNNDTTLYHQVGSLNQSNKIKNVTDISHKLQVRSLSNNPQVGAISKNNDQFEIFKHARIRFR